MELIEDRETYAAAAEELAIRFITRMAICLHTAPEIEFDVTHADAAQSDLLFDICFKGAVEFEEQSGIEVGGTKHTPGIAFHTSSPSTENDILIGGALVHGLIDDPQIVEGVSRARQSVSKAADGS